MFQLKKQSDFSTDNIADMPTVFEGTEAQILQVTRLLNLVWVPVQEYLFGGYWRTQDGSVCYYPW